MFKGPGTSDNIVWWGDEEAAKVGGHGPATLGFGQVEGTVSVFDPTLGTTAVATFSNISTLSIGNFGDGPLVVQVSNTTGTVTGGTSAVGTYAGVSAAATGVTTTVGASGSTTFTTQSGGQNTVTTTATGKRRRHQPGRRHGERGRRRLRHRVRVGRLGHGQRRCRQPHLRRRQRQLLGRRRRGRGHPVRRLGQRPRSSAAAGPTPSWSRAPATRRCRAARAAPPSCSAAPHPPPSSAPLVAATR